MHVPTAVLLPLLVSLLVFADAEEEMDPGGTTGMPGPGSWDSPDNSGIPESVILITGLNYNAVKNMPGKMDLLSYYAVGLLSNQFMVEASNVRVVAIYPQYVAPDSTLAHDTVIKFDVHHTEPTVMDYQTATATIPGNLVLEIEGTGDFASAVSSTGLSAAMYPSTSPWTMTYTPYIVEFDIAMAAINPTWSEVGDPNSLFYTRVLGEVYSYFSVAPGQVSFSHMANEMYRLRLDFRGDALEDSEILALAASAVSEVGGRSFREGVLRAVHPLPTFQQEHGVLQEFCIDYMAVTSHYIGDASNGVETCVTPGSPEATTMFPVSTVQTTIFPVATEQTTIFPVATEQTTIFPVATEQTTIFPVATEQTTIFPAATEQTTIFPVATEQTTIFPVSTEQTTREGSSSPSTPPSSSSRTTSWSSSGRRRSTSRMTTMTTSPMKATTATRMVTTSRMPWTSRMTTTSRTRMATTSRTRMATTAHGRTTRRTAVRLNGPGMDDVYERESRGGSADHDEERVKYPSGAGHHRQSARRAMWTKYMKVSRKVFVMNAPTSLRDGLITMDNCPYWKKLLGLDGECAQGRLVQQRDGRRLSEIVV